MNERDLLLSSGILNHLQGPSRTIEEVDRIIHVTTGIFSSSALKAASAQEEIPIIDSIRDKDLPSNEKRH